MEIKDDDLKLVHWTVHKFFPNYVGDEDLFQTMCLALAEAKDKYDGTVKDNQTHLVNLMRWAVWREWRTNKRHNPDGVVPMSLDCTLDLRNNGIHDKLLDRYAAVAAPEYHPWSVDLPDWMNDKEKIVTEMLAQGYSQREIAEVLGTTHQRVSEIKRKLQKKLLQKGYLSKEEADDRKRNCKRCFRPREERTGTSGK